MESGGCNKITENKRRIWSTKEEETLIDALKEIILAGFKCENGFRTGYLSLLEKHMARAIPRAGIRAVPHINNKIHVWKKQYGSLSGMQSRSGFGWNDVTNMIIVDSDAIFDDYVRIDTYAKTLRFRIFPYYKSWCEIFGKDRATGEHAMDFNDEGTDVHGDYIPNCNFENVGLDNNPTGISTEDENDFMSSCQASPMMSGSSKKTKSNKRMFAEVTTKETSKELVGLMGSFCTETSAKLGEIAQRIGHEIDISQKQTDVYEALGSLGELTTKQKIYVGKLLVNNKSDMNMFFSLPAEAKMEMVHMMLSGQY